MADFIIGTDGYPVPTEMPTRPQYANQAPFPASEWRQDDNVNDGYPYTLLTAERPEKAFVQPYPYATWRTDVRYNEGYPFHMLQPEIPPTVGAFYNSQLERVFVPITVKAIGATAFYGTKLRHVRIAADATYNDTYSFPSDCIITRYPDDRYDQLYDCDGKAVLDYDGARVYVLKEDNNNG